MSPSASVWMGAKFRPDLACQIAIQPSKSGGTVTSHFNLYPLPASAYSREGFSVRQVKKVTRHLFQSSLFESDIRRFYHRVEHKMGLASRFIASIHIESHCLRSRIVRAER
jgi:hypothetical protein